MRKIFFDLDGTLFQAHLTVSIALQKTLEDFQLPKPNHDMVIKGIGMTMENFLMEYFPSFLEVDKFKQRFREHEWAAVREHGRLFDGMVELLQQLFAQQYQLYVCSNGSMEYIELVIECMGISSLFRELISSKGFPSKGEAISPFIQQGDFALVVGDTMNDLKGAKSVNIPVIAALYGYGSREELTGADFFVNSPMEIPEYIRALEFKGLFEGNN